MLCTLCNRRIQPLRGERCNSSGSLHCELVLCGEVRGSVEACSHSEGWETAPNRSDVESWAHLGRNLELSDLACKPDTLKI